MNPVDLTRTELGAREWLRAHQRVAPAAFAPSAAPSLEGKKLRKAAMDFESLLIASLWQSMQSDSLGATEAESDPGADTLKQLGVQAMSTALAAAGGLGIGQLLLRQLVPAVERKSSVVGPDLPFLDVHKAAVSAYK